jgi:hypothetical protein
MLRPSVTKAIHDALEADKFFTSHDFDIVEIKYSHQITYRHRKGVRFEFRLPGEPKEDTYGNRVHPISTTSSPGQVSGSESVAVTGLSGLVAEITDWENSPGS